jgi:adenine-specific DNA-methyltransferase
MKKRLVLARKLLKNSGVIFISIDDNEQATLKILCDEVFGPGNFIANIIWQKKYSPQNDAKYFSDMHDFIIVFAKKRNQGVEKNGWIRNLSPRTKEMDTRYKNPDNDPRGDWKSADLSAKRLTPKDVYPIKTPSGRITNPPKGRSWASPKKKMQELIDDNRIWFGKNGNNVPARKVFLSEVQQGTVPVTWWSREFAGHNQDAKQELKRFDLTDIIETPKPVKLIKRILQIASRKNSIILDFFAGSGTTGHSVLELNKDDGGNRKFILCTNDEGNICTKVCYPRIKNVIRGYTNTKKEKVKGLGGNLKYFKTDFVDGEPTDKNKKKLVEQCTEMLCLREDCFDEIKQTKTYSIFKNHEEKYLGIIYDDDGIEPLKKQIKSTGKKFNVYVFSLDDSAREEEFEDIIDMVDLKPIPEVILNVYRRIFR